MSAQQMKIVIGIDMETDIGSFTPFYEGVKHGTPLLIELFKKKAVKATFYFTGECAKMNPDIIRMVLESRNEIGCHSFFHETLGNDLFPLPGIKPVLQQEVPFRIKTATEWVEEVSGTRPVSFCCPRLWGSTAVVNTLKELGFIKPMLPTRWISTKTSMLHIIHQGITGWKRGI